MLIKSEFVKIINQLQETNEMVDKVNEIYRNSRENIECDFCNASAMSISHEGIVIQLLENIFKDETNICYFVYESKYGKEWKTHKITESDGTEIYLKTSEDLYDYLIKNMEE
ncbi:MAG: hypothetical protein RR322_01760 [Oscillospiraceae bacterium]